MITIEESLINRLGGKENFEQNIFNYQILNRLELPEYNGIHDLLFGSFEIKGIFNGVFGNKKYFFLEGGDKNDSMYDLDDFSFPAIKFNSNTMDEKIISQQIEKIFEEVKKIAQNITIAYDLISKINNIKIKNIRYERIMSNEEHRIENPTDTYFYLDDAYITLFYLETGEEKTLTPEEIIKYYK